MPSATLGTQQTNTTARYDFSIEGAHGRSLAGVFSGVETFEAVLYPGDDRAGSAVLSAAWIDHTLKAPTWRLTVARAAIEASEPGVYQLQVVLNPDTDDQPLLPPGTTLELVAGPGTSDAPAAYCSARDILDECPWIERLQAESDQAGFARQRRLAREWTDGLLHRHYRPPLVERTQTTFAWPFGPLRTGARDPWLVEQLDAGRLVVTPDVRRLNVLYALSLVLRHQVGTVPSGAKTTYQALGAAYRAEAESLAACITAEVADEDGRTVAVIDPGTVDTLRA